jgi:hypothetical protein
MEEQQQPEQRLFEIIQQRIKAGYQQGRAYLAEPSNRRFPIQTWSWRYWCWFVINPVIDLFSLSGCFRQAAHLQ